MSSRVVDIRIQAKLSLDQTPRKAKAHKPHLSRVSNLPSFCPGPVKPPFAISKPITHLAAHTATYTHGTPFSKNQNRQSTPVSLCPSSRYHMRARTIPVCPEKTDEADGRADNRSRSQHSRLIAFSAMFGRSTPRSSPSSSSTPCLFPKR